MAISTDFKYENLLSLDKAVLVKRSRLNFLGSKELILNYNNVTSAAREDCVEWLSTNRLSITDPEFGFKKYEGAWSCVDITYDEKKHIIHQSFKVDSSLENSVTDRSESGTTEKSYYWKVVDPTIYNIPSFKSAGGTSPVLTDLYWDDRGDENDNQAVYYDSSDTYALWWDNSALLYKISLIADVGGSPTNYFSSSSIAASTDNPTNGSYTGTGTYTGTVVMSEVEYLNEVWTKTANDNGDGTYDVVISKEELNEISGSGAVRMWGESGTQAAAGNYDIILSGCITAAMDGTYEFDGGVGIARTWTHTSGSYLISHGEYAETGSGSGTYKVSWMITPKPAPTPVYGVIHADWYMRIVGVSPTTVLAGNGWRSGWGDTVGTAAPSLTLELGKNPPEYQELVLVTVNSPEMEFVADGGTVADPTVGQLKTISNIPLGNGKFKTTITTRTVNPQRIPAIPNTGLLQFASNGNEEWGGTIVAKSQTLQSLNEDVNMLETDRLAFSNGLSVTINKYGLYDYTIVSNQRA